MSKETIMAALSTGQDDAHMLLEMVKYREVQFSSDEEKLVWWTAFMGYLGGMCAASLGPASIQAIEAMTKKTTTELLQEHAH